MTEYIVLMMVFEFAWKQVASVVGDDSNAGKKTESVCPQISNVRPH